MDVTGMEYTGYGVKGEGGYWLEDSVYFQLLTYYPFEDRSAYDEASMLTRIKALMGGDIELRTLSLSDEHGARLGVPVWRIVYDSGDAHDHRACMDLYFSGDLGEHFKFGEYWVHTEIAADAPDDKYHDEIERRLATVALLPPLAIDTAGLESINPLETEWTDGTLYIGIQSFVAADGVLDEAGVVERVKSLNGRESPFELIAVNDLGKNSELQTSHLWKIEYFSGGNEDTNRCADLYFRTDYHEGRTDYGEYWLHTSVDGDFELSDGADEYDVAGAIGRIFESAKLETSYTDMLYLATDYPYDD
jgi:hypothetical protein